MKSRAMSAQVGMFLVATAVAGQAQDHVHAPGQERLGTVHFETSCAPAVAPGFNRAIALLHSFEFGPAITAFEGVIARDPSCAMAWWGIALSRWTNPMVPNIRPAALLALGQQATDRALRLASRATPREQGYIHAVSELYRDHAQRAQAARVAAYEVAMGTLSRTFPADREARIFHAIAIVAAASPSDKTYANQLRAGDMLEALFREYPDHPGLAHYIIHAYDVPALAERAAAAARRYADIAPSASHALHMPSHTFTRVGMWEESVNTNRRSMEVALRDSTIAEALHAADYMVYAWLQMRRDSQALALLHQLPALAARFDPSVVRGAAPGSAGLFALAAIPARYALERLAWKEAAALQPRTTAFPYTEAVTWFARALGGVNTGDTVLAHVAVDSLRAFRARLLAEGEGYWAEQVAVQQLGAEAWLNLARGWNEAALARMAQAADREDATEKPAVSPGPLAPARELLGDMLLRLGRHRDALEEYREALTREPNRYRTLDGARRAASALGARDEAAQYTTVLRQLTGQ